MFSRQRRDWTNPGCGCTYWQWCTKDVYTGVALIRKGTKQVIVEGAYAAKVNFDIYML